MEVTITNNEREQKRVCLHCGSSIEKGNAKKQYCSDNCKVAHHRRKQIQNLHLAEQMVKQKDDRIQELESEPVKQKTFVQVSNPAWQLANQAYTNQVKICLGLEAQLKDLELEDREMKSGSRGAFYGAATGIGFGLFWIAAIYDTYQSKKLGMAFLVGSLFILMVMGVVGYWIGKKLHTYLLSNNEQVNTEIAKNSQKKDALERRLKAGQQDLFRLQNRLGQKNRYKSEVITSVENVHS